MLQPVMATLATDAARRFGDGIALTLPGAVDLSFREIDARAGRFAGGLVGFGIERGIASCCTSQMVGSGSSPITR